MIPSDSLSSTFVSGVVDPPRNIPPPALTSYHTGGIAVNDATQGLLYQTWTATADVNGINLSAPNTTQYQLVAVPGVTALSLAFTQNMQPFVVYQTVNGFFYYWYDSLISGYTTSALPVTVSAALALLDDARLLESNSSDVLLVYLNSGALVYRQERDRYGIEYPLSAGPYAQLTNLGFSSDVLRVIFFLQ